MGMDEVKEKRRVKKKLYQLSREQAEQVYAQLSQEAQHIVSDMANGYMAASAERARNYMERVDRLLSGTELVEVETDGE